MTIDFSLVYNSYNADGSRTSLDTILGFGWTHSYNIFLFSQSTNDMFRMDGTGRITKYQPASNGTFTPTTGYFEILTQNADGTFTLRRKDGILFHFALIPDTPFTFEGSPVYRLTQIIDRNNNTTTLLYANGNLTQITDTYGRSLTLAYTSRNKLAAITDPLGRTTRLTYDSTGTQLIRITDPGGKSVQYSYNDLFQIIRKTDKDGRRFTYIYDQGKPVAIRDGAGNALFRLTNPLNWATDDSDLLRKYIPTTTSRTDGRRNVWKYDYEEHGYITQIVAPDGVTTRYTYAPATLMLASMTDANSHTTVYEYDALGNRTKMTDALGQLTTFTYEPVFSQMTNMTDPNGRVTSYEYDARGNRTREIDPLGNARERTYDAHGNILTEKDKNGNVSIYEYDAFSNLITQINGASDVARFTYDGVGNVITITPPNGNVITLAYDFRDRLLRADDRVGVFVIYTYDGEGNRLSQTDGNGNRLFFAYDLRQRLAQTTDALGQVTTQTYDGNNNRISITDRNGHTIAFQFDEQNRLIQTRDALGNRSRRTYDGVGNLVRILDAKNHSTAYEYDDVNRLVKETYADGGMRTFTFDAASNLLTRTDQKGQSTTYTYDALNRLTARSYPLSPPDILTYDAEGRMLTAERGNWPVTFTYDGANRLVQTTQNGQGINYIYDIPGRTRTISYPGGRFIVEQTDFRNRLDAIDDGRLSPIVQYTYDFGNRVGSRTYRNGTVANYTYNANDWVVELEHSLGAMRIAGFGHDYDREGNKKFEEKRHDSSRSEVYQYDAIDRLIDFKVGQLVGSTVPVPLTQSQYNLDPVGNWNSKVTDGIIENRTHNTVNEIRAINGVPIAHDANGNLQRDERFVYAYDEENRLIRVTRRAGRPVVVAEYQYDALGRRVVKRANPGGIATETRYFYDTARIIEEQNASSVTQATYVYGNYIDEVLTMDRGGQSFFYHQNTLWSVAALTDNAAKVVERYTYDAYGCVASQSAIGNPYLFTGRQLDEETGLYFYRARYYDCVKGRFLQRDPLGYVDGMNLYEYVSGNPTRYTDPYGAQKWGRLRCLCQSFKCTFLMAGCVAAVPAVVITCTACAASATILVPACLACLGSIAGGILACEEAYDCWSRFVEMCT